MTKAVRIENADGNTSVKVIVEVWDKTADGDKLADTIELCNPADMTGMLYGKPGVYLTSTRYLVVKEAPQ